MEALRWVSIVALATWVGGLVTLGAVVAPELFQLLARHDPAGGRELAAYLFGALLGSFQYVAWVAGGLLLASLALRAAIGPRPRRTALRVWTVAAMLTASVLLSLVIAPRIDAIRAETKGTIAARPADDPLRVQFGRLHGLSSGLMLATVLAGLGLLWAEMKDRH